MNFTRPTFEVSFFFFFFGLRTLGGRLRIGVGLDSSNYGTYRQAGTSITDSSKWHRTFLARFETWILLFILMVHVVCVLGVTKFCVSCETLGIVKGCVCSDSRFIVFWPKASSFSCLHSFQQQEPQP